MENPIVSIIVPIYNTAKYLPKCLDSILSQTYSNIEVICFIDASPDNSLQIVEEYAVRDKRIKLINSFVNVKQGGGRNRGIIKSKGDYVAFVDSDDWISPDYVKCLITPIIEDGADVTTCNYYQVNHGKCTEISLTGDCVGMSVDEIKRNILRNGAFIWSGIYRKSIITDNNLFFPEGVIYEDNAVTSAIYLSAKRIVKVNKPLYYYRNDNVSTVRTLNSPNFFDRLTTANLFKENLKRLGYYDEYREDVDYIWLRLYYSNTISGLLDRFKPVPYKKIREIQRKVLVDYGYKGLFKYINTLRMFDRPVMYMSLIWPRLGHWTYMIERRMCKLFHR